MSRWSYVKGMVEVSAMGRTQAECTYILETVIAHLPKVRGSEHDMYIHLVQCGGHDESSSHDEFHQWLHGDWIEKQTNYLIVIEGALRHKVFDETYRSVINWLMRLAKRVMVDSCLIRVSGDDEHFERHSSIIEFNDMDDYFEHPSWTGNGTVNWSEYLMWKELRSDKGHRLIGKPDFSDGTCLDFMSDTERKKRLCSKGDKNGSR